MGSLIESFWMRIFEIIIAMLFTMMGIGCISPPDNTPVQEQIDAQAATFANTTKLLADAGVSGTLIMDFSLDGYAGIFNGAMWKMGPSLMAVVELNPENATKLNAILANKKEIPSLEEP